jgi:hypothetical protein
LVRRKVVNEVTWGSREALRKQEGVARARVDQWVAVEEIAGEVIDFVLILMNSADKWSFHESGGGKAFQGLR